MITEERVRILSNFFLDGAKIIFGSLVVGVFVPGTQSPDGASWLTLTVGLLTTAAFLVVAIRIKKKTMISQL
mgnify:CR=1 FL=1